MFGVGRDKGFVAFLARRVLLSAASVAALVAAVVVVLGVPSAISAVLLFGGARFVVRRVST